jgi:hypothetical protein
LSAIAGADGLTSHGRRVVAVAERR